MLKNLTIGITLGIFALYLLLVLSLFAFIDPQKLVQTIASERVWFSMTLSLKAAVIATSLSMLLAIPAAYALSRYEFPGKRIVDVLLELPLS